MPYFWQGQVLFRNGMVAANEDCCCERPRVCAGCPPGTVPQYLQLIFDYFKPTILPDFTDCVQANSVEGWILEYMLPQPFSPIMEWLEVPQDQSCKYLYHNGTPWSHGADGWCAELFLWSNQFGGQGNEGQIVFYQTEGTQDGDEEIIVWKNGAPVFNWLYKWGQDPFNLGWQQVGYTNTPLPCNNWDKMGSGNDATHAKEYIGFPPPSPSEWMYWVETGSIGFHPCWQASPEVIILQPYFP